MLHVLSSLSNKNHTNPLSLTSLSQLNLLAMGLRPLSNRDTIQPWMGHWPSSTPTLESERRSRVEGRGIDPESCDYDLSNSSMARAGWIEIEIAARQPTLAVPRSASMATTSAGQHDGRQAEVTATSNDLHSCQRPHPHPILGCHL